MTSYDREYRKCPRTDKSRERKRKNSPDGFSKSLDSLKLKIYTEKALSLYNASIDQFALDSALRKAYEKDIADYLMLEEKLAVYNNLRRKAEEFNLLGNLERKVHYESAALYFMAKFI